MDPKELIGRTITDAKWKSLDSLSSERLWLTLDNGRKISIGAAWGTEESTINLEA